MSACRPVDGPRDLVVRLFDTNIDLHRLVEEAARPEVLARDRASLWPPGGGMGRDR